MKTLHIITCASFLCTQSLFCNTIMIGNTTFDLTNKNNKELTKLKLKNDDWIKNTLNRIEEDIKDFPKLKGSAFLNAQRDKVFDSLGSLTIYVDNLKSFIEEFQNRKLPTP